ncbi:MAG: acylneuraminate cytidylyltransferase family protein [Candidatus Kerfeldbacteria bacterium]|nr:acylneuraminate cytidylyltransferase family protein [Candidatus Kerfeldbacteria bacterium]
MSVPKRREILGLIPTRGGSKGLEGKNLRILEGKPLIAYAIESVAKEFGAEVFRHPAEFSNDGKPTFPVIQYVTRALINAGDLFELVTTMRATTPLRHAEDISGAIQQLLDTNADSVVSLVADPTGHPMRLKQVGPDLRIIPIHLGEEDAPIVRQDLPLVYRRNGAVYVTRTPIILGGSLFGRDSRGYIMPKERSININDEVDFICAAALLRAARERQS